MKHLRNFNEAKKPGLKVEKIEKLDYHDMMKFLEKKYNFESRGFSGIPSKKMKEDRYMDFWHYLVDYNPELSNGSFIHIPEKAAVDKMTPERTIKMWKDLIDMYPKDKKIRKNAEELIRREEEAMKNPKVDPFENWEQEITDLIFKEFGEYAKGKPGDRYLEVWVDW
jgi:hypothetical protein